MEKSNSLEDSYSNLQPNQLLTPILFLIFNRPESTSKVFDAIRKVKPTRLYVAADGPRADKKIESQLVLETRKIAAQVDWKCEVRTLYRDQNLGCKNAISEAISWFFEQEEQGIILEDDCLPSQSFFWYCDELLDLYRDDTSVMTIGGVNYQNGIQRGEGSYYGTKYFHCWGWASWRRAWSEYDRDLKSIKGTIEKGLVKLSDGNAFFIPYWKDIIGDCLEGRNSSWAYPMSITCFAREGSNIETLHLAPQINLVENIGFESGGTHTNEGTSNPSELKHDISFPLTHPKYITRDLSADKWTDRHHFHITLIGYLKRKVGRKFPRLKQSLIRFLRRS